MTSNTVGKILVGLAAWLFVGASMMDCASDLPLSNPGGSGGNSGGGGKGGNGGNGGAAENGGNGAAGQTTIITTRPSGNADANVQDVEPVVASADANCGVQTQNPKPKQVDLLLVLDRSGSMAYDIASGSNCNVGSTTCTQRWATVTASLKQVLAATPASVQWGLKLFTSPKGSTCTVNSGADVQVGPNSAAQIQTTMTGTSPANQTPTRDAINKAVAYYNTLNDGLAHYILLATDGQPNCDTGTSSSTTTAAVTNTVAAITAAAAPGTDIKTYVIGIGPEAGNLTAFAQAGGTTDFFPASSPDALTQALTTIVGTVASCDFTMAEQPSDPTNLGVYLDNTTKVPRDSAEGYSLGADSVTVTLNGSYCAGLKDGTFKVVQVFFGCPGVPPPDNF